MIKIKKRLKHLKQHLASVRSVLDLTEFGDAEYSNVLLCKIVSRLSGSTDSAKFVSTKVTSPNRVEKDRKEQRS